MACKDGSLILLKVGGTTLSGLLSNDFNYTVDTIECTTKDSNRHKEYIAGEDGSTVDFECLYNPAGDYSLVELMAAAKAKVAVAFVIGGVVAGDETVSGNAIITSVAWSNGKNDISGISGSLQVTGDVTVGVVTDAVVPVLESAAVNNASPTILRLTFSENLDPAYVVAGTAWAADGSVTGAKTVSSTSISKNKINLTMNEAYGATDVITVAYTAPGGAQDIRDLSGNLLVSFTEEAVTNNITA
jgi:predicted secreted protein